MIKSSIMPEEVGFYGRFDHVTTRFISPYTFKNGILFVKYIRRYHNALQRFRLNSIPYLIFIGTIRRVADWVTSTFYIRVFQANIQI